MTPDDGVATPRLPRSDFIAGDVNDDTLDVNVPRSITNMFYWNQSEDCIYLRTLLL